MDLSIVPYQAPTDLAQHVPLLLRIGRLALRVEALRAIERDLASERHSDPCVRAEWPDPPCFQRDVPMRAWSVEGVETWTDKRWKVWPGSMCRACQRNGERAVQEAEIRRRIAGVRAALTRIAREALAAGVNP